MTRQDNLLNILLCALESGVTVAAKSVRLMYAKADLGWSYMDVGTCEWELRVMVKVHVWMAFVLPICLLGCQAQQNKDCFRQCVDAINSRDLARLDDYIVSNYVRHCQATPGIEVHSIEEFKHFLETDFATIPDSVVDIDWLVAEGDMLAFYCTYSGTQTGQMGPFPPSGKRATLDFAGVHRFENGKIAETWLTWDNIYMLTELGHFHPTQDGGQ